MPKKQFNNNNNNKAAAGVDQQEEAPEQLFDAFMQFLKNDLWQIPVSQFVEQHSTVFEREPDLMSGDDGVVGAATGITEYQKIHKNFSGMINDLINAFCQDSGCNRDQLMGALKAADRENGLSQKQRMLLEPIVAARDFDVFMPMMMRKNIELQLQALKMIEHMKGLLPSSLKLGQEDAEIWDALFEEEESDRLILISVLKQSKAEWERDQRMRQEWQNELELAIRESLRDKTMLEQMHRREQQLMEEALRKNADSFNLDFTKMNIPPSSTTTTATAAAATNSSNAEQSEMTEAQQALTTAMARIAIASDEKPLPPSDKSKGESGGVAAKQEKARDVSSAKNNERSSDGGSKAAASLQMHGKVEEQKQQQQQQRMRRSSDTVSVSYAANNKKANQPSVAFKSNNNKQQNAFAAVDEGKEQQQAPHEKENAEQTVAENNGSLLKGGNGTKQQRRSLGQVHFSPSVCSNDDGDGGIQRGSLAYRSLLKEREAGISEGDLQTRMRYLREQRDKLVAKKSEERQKQLLEATRQQMNADRPRTAQSAARGMLMAAAEQRLTMDGGVKKQEEEVLAERRRMAAKIKAEVIDKQQQQK